MRILRFIKRILIVLLILSPILYLGLYYIAKVMPKLSIESANRLYIYDNNDNLVDDLNDTWITLDNVSEYLIKATISIEDKNFYNHSGFDYLRILKSLYINTKNRKNLQGASTISQQLSKNLFLSFEKTWQRKIKEAWLTIQLESQYNKNIFKYN